MGILKWLSQAKKEKNEQTRIILALFLYYIPDRVSNFVVEGVMSMWIRITGLLLLLVFTPLLKAQERDEAAMVKHSPDFEFNNGIFANFEMVKDNDPISPARIVSDVDMFDRGFYDKITAQKEIIIYDDNGVKKVMKTANIWGYGRNGVLYINVGSAFHRISFVGSISHFVASVTTYSSNYYDPYYNPYYSNSYNYNRYNQPQSNYASSELRQYLLDFETGEVLEYDTKGVEVLLMKDPELADEFMALKNRKKKQMKFVFIRKFNEKHPLYFPE